MMDKHHGPLTEEQKKDAEIRRLRSENAILNRNLSKMKRGAAETQEYHFNLSREWDRKKSAFKSRIAELEKALERIKNRADAYTDAGAPLGSGDIREALQTLRENIRQEEGDDSE